MTSEIPLKSKVFKMPLKRQAEYKPGQEKTQISCFEVILPQGRSFMLTSIYLHSDFIFFHTTSGLTLNDVTQGQHTSSVIATGSLSCFPTDPRHRFSLQLIFMEFASYI